MFKNILYSVLSLVAAFIPLWIFLFFRFLLQPNGFWQNLLIYGLGIYLLGFFQIFLLLMELIVLLKIWNK